MVNNKFESIVLIGEMGGIAKTFENAWFNWQWGEFSRISSYANEKEAISTIKALLEKDFNVIAIWDKPTGTGGALITEGLEKLELLFRCAQATEVELCLCRPDALVEEQWRQYVSDQTVIPDTESIPIDFLEAYTTAMNKWIPSLCRPDQAKFLLKSDSDFSKIWSRSSSITPNPANIIFQVFSTKLANFLASITDSEEQPYLLAECAGSDDSINIEEHSFESWQAEGINLSIATTKGGNFIASLEVKNSTGIEKYELSIKSDGNIIAETVMETDLDGYADEELKILSKVISTEITKFEIIFKKI